MRLKVLIAVCICAVALSCTALGYYIGKTHQPSDDVQETPNTQETPDLPDTPTFAAGSGAEKDPFVIETTEDLSRLAQYVNSGSSFEGCHFVLINDLDLASAEWTPIGSYRYPFDGSFNGNDHTITGLSITKAPLDTTGQNNWHNSIECVGLFGLAGDRSCIENLRVEGRIAIDKPDGPEKDDVIAGGIVGMTRGKVYNCHNACDISVSVPSFESYINVGGVCGVYTWESALIDSCSNTGALFGEGPVVRIGGVCGDNDGHGVVRNCVNLGNISVGKRTENHIVSYIGGIVAHTANSTVSNCANYGTLQGLDVAGGIVGRQYGTDDFGGDSFIINCLNDAQVTITERDLRCGAVCGDTDYGSIDQCYYTGNEVAVGQIMLEAKVENMVQCAALSADERLEALNAWVERNSNAESMYTVWSLDAAGRAVPIVLP